MRRSPWKLALALVSGALFGAGLTVSRMIDPGKVAAFLDVAGRWDPSLALVMASALGVTGLAYRLVLGRRPAPLLDSKFHLSSVSQVDGRLLLGSALFGIGWGLGGLCPGPALASLSFGVLDTAIFVASMISAMWLWENRARLAALASTLGGGEPADAPSRHADAHG